MKHKIEKIFINDTDAQGKQYVSKNGDLYKKVKVKVNGTYYTKNCFAINDPELGWKEGEEHDIEFVDNEKDSVVYHNFLSREVNNMPISNRQSSPQSAQPTQQVKSENAKKLDDILEIQNEVLMDNMEIHKKVDEILRIINLK